ncbi:type II cytoskeletal 8-like [Nothobranchius furzeri]|uniref:Type II cytoskeletal 8-like n=1 Tax=Nothobranchius furzeri TaxID=105023 RepID=A0A9D2XWU4_NOTFU|nr:type II cytoskeletal 8-like [Nothobranchius furzeri]
MSLRNKRRSRSEHHFSARSFTRPALGSSTNPKTSNSELVTAVSVNKSLLAPLNLEIDPKIQALRNQEKDKIKGLNNRFVSFIDKVRLLEQQNKLLKTKWKLLQEQSAASSDIDPLFNSYISSLQRQLEQLNRDKHAFGVENEHMHKLVDDYREKIEDERNKRTDAENCLVYLKKDVDEGRISLSHLGTLLSSMGDEIAFLKAVYDQELDELMGSTQETCVVVEMDNSRDLDMDHIISSVRAHYEEIAARSKEETETCYRTQVRRTTLGQKQIVTIPAVFSAFPCTFVFFKKVSCGWAQAEMGKVTPFIFIFLVPLSSPHRHQFDQMAAQASQYDSQLHNTQDEVAHLKGLIAHLQNEISAVKKQAANLKDGINKMEADGEKASLYAKYHIRDLEEALKRAKLEMAKQIKDYQTLVGIKMTLDIEISTYKKMLEAEECRMTLNYNPVQTHQAAPSRENLPGTSGPVLIKMTQSMTYK